MKNCKVINMRLDSCFSKKKDNVSVDNQTRIIIIESTCSIITFLELSMLIKKKNQYINYNKTI